jgi:hypothetical protein
VRSDRRRIRRALLVGCLAALGAAACGDSSGDGSSSSTDAPPSGDGSDANPPPPHIPRNFTWTGRYDVPDLDIEVPFTWTGNDGNMQMIAGSEDAPIYFTNLIYDGVLYTLTYEWPGIERRPCSPIGPFTLHDLNQGLASARLVGPETIDVDDVPRQVYHWRVGVVFEPPPDLISIPGIPSLRLPLMSGDIYVDRDDPTDLWQVLQFGIQNLYDPEQDEWIRIDEIEDAAGDIELPDECTTASTPPDTGM